MEARPVIVTTEYRGVFFGYTADSTDKILETGITQLKGAKMAIYWGTEKGVMQLAHTGPTNKSRISAPADLGVNKITGVFEVTPEAEAVWKKA